MRAWMLFLSVGASGVPAGANAAEDHWSFAFGQGVAEYAVGSFADGGSHLALSCAEGGISPGLVSVQLRRAGFQPDRPTSATFVTDQGQVRLAIGTDGSVRYPSVAAAPAFRTLWRLLATGKTLHVNYGPDEPMRLPLTGAAELLGTTVCPKQLAD